MTKVVAGRIVNGYCRGDWLLGFLYRGSSAQLSVAGLQPVSVNDRRIINVDLSSVVKGHLDYMRQMDTILVAVGVPTREAPGASGGALQLLTTSDGKLNFLDPSLQKEVTDEQKVESSLVSVEETCGGEDSGVAEVEENEEKGDGWDIPDISDLLDSLNDTGTDDRKIVEDSTSLGPEENPPHEDIRSAVECDGQETESDGEEGERSDSEHTSWSWDDTHWTSEQTHTKAHQKNSHRT